MPSSTRGSGGERRRFTAIVLEVSRRRVTLKFQRLEDVSPTAE
jgi:hypothetical protein